MIYPSLGISIFTHMVVIGTVKVKSFLGIRPNKKMSRNATEKKEGVFKKVFVSLTIAAIMESIFLLVIGSSVAVVYFGIMSNNSNFNIIKNDFYKPGIERNSTICTPNETCFSELKITIPDAFASLS